MSELRELLAKATERPWRLSEKGSSIRSRRMLHREDGSEIGEVDSRLVFGHDGSAGQREADFALIVAAVNELPALLDRIEQLEADIASLETRLDDATAPWPAWAERILHILESYGAEFEPGEEIDLPEELAQWLSDYEAEARAAGERE